MQQTDVAIAAGDDVFDAEGEKLGTVTEIGRNYVLVQKGKIFIEDLYVPFSAVTGTDPLSRNVVVGVRRSEIRDLGWDVPPPYDPPARVRDDGNPDISIFRTTPVIGAAAEGTIEVQPEATLA